MNISYNGIGQVCATFNNTGVTEGYVVKMSGHNTVHSCFDEERFFGVALCCKEDACTVQVQGFVTVNYSGSAPAAGWTTLAANGSGGVKAVSTGGQSYLVVNSDTTAKTVTFLL